MTNLFSSTEPVDFWVWVNPKNWLVRHQVSVVGGFTSGGLVPGEKKSNLIFIPNPDFVGDITPFQYGVMREYMAEYNLEMGREFYKYQNYPSRLNAIYLFDSEEEAHKYKTRHMSHVDGRVLKKAKSVTPYIYSKHDSSWVDFLRLTHSVDPETISYVSRAYWSGVNVSGCQLMSMGEPWSQDPIIEILFIGRIEFYDRKLDCQHVARADTGDSAPCLLLFPWPVRHTSALGVLTYSKQCADNPEMGYPVMGFNIVAWRNHYIPESTNTSDHY